MPATAASPSRTDRPGRNAHSPIQRYLERVHAELAPIFDGAVASYIPELTRAAPAWFGICIASADGAIYEVGDTRVEFTIQSISKALVYGLALEDRGKAAVLDKIGVEPSGDAFNSISLQPDSGRPFNPMINAGAITSTSLTAGGSPEDRFERIRRLFSMYAGRELALDEEVYRSEATTGHRNRAIGHMLRNFEILNADPEPDLDLYFRQCSIRVDCRDLAIMAATMAGGGINPVTKERVVPTGIVRDVLSVMTTCGMYDFAGEWVYRVGMPAKSGVGGGILAVLPGELGIGVFSPLLDQRGNSVRGVRVCEALSNAWGLHFLAPPRAALSAVRTDYSLAHVRSKRRRRAYQTEALAESGLRARIFELQGDLNFGSAEVAVRRILDCADSLDYVIIDLKRVPQVDAAASELMVELVKALSERGTVCAFTTPKFVSPFLRYAEEHLGDADPPLRTFGQLDAGLEWCENKLLESLGTPPPPDEPCDLSSNHLCEGLSNDELKRLRGIVEQVHFARGSLMVRKGDPADRLFMMISGEASVTLALPNGQEKRLSTITPGMSFGENGLAEGGVRSADVRADRDVDCYVLTEPAFSALAKSDPGLQAALLRNLLRMAVQTTGRLTREVAALES